MLDAEAIIASVTAVAAGLAKGRSTTEVVLLAAIFEQLGDSLAAIAVAREKLEDLCGGTEGDAAPHTTDPLDILNLNEANNVNHVI